MEYNVQMIDDTYSNREYVVEHKYIHLFDAPKFEAKVLEINKIIQSSNKKKISISLKDTDQDQFIERYYKINGYDAFLNPQGGITIYLKKNNPTP